MKKGAWLIWMILIVLIVFLFPKPCGLIPPSKILDARCDGINLIKTLSSNNSNGSIYQKWCSGMCSQTLKKINSTLGNSTSPSDSDPIVTSMIDAFKEAIPKLLMIFLLIMIIVWINNMRKGKGGTNISVVKGP